MSADGERTLEESSLARLPKKMPLSAWPAEDTDSSERRGSISTRWKLPVFLPECRERQVWQVLMILPLFWTGTVMPYRLSFVSFRTTSEGFVEAEHPYSAWDAFDQIMNAFFIMDLVLNFTFAFYDSFGNLVQDPSCIARSYLKGWFWPDLVACLPHQTFQFLLGSVPGTHKILRIPRLYRIFRLFKIGRTFRLLKLKKVVGSMIARACRGYFRFRAAQRILRSSRSAHVVKLILVLCGLAHIMCCMWYLIAAFGDPDEIWLAARGISDESNFTHWLHSIYFVLTTFTTVGFGDIQPVTDAEVAVAVLLMTIGAVVNSVIVSEVIAVLTRVDGTNAEVRRKQAAMEKYTDVIGVRNEALRGRITKFCEYTTLTKRASLEQNDGSQLVWSAILDLPRDVMSELLSKIFQGSLMRNKLFSLDQEVDGFVLAIAASAYLSSRIFVGGGDQPGRSSTLYSYGDSPTGMYLIQDGVVAHVGVPHERGGISDPSVYLRTENCSQYCYQIFGRKGYVGEWELIYPHPRVATVRAEGNVSCLHLPRHGFLQLVSSFPQFFERMKRIARRREERRLKKLQGHKWELDVFTFAIVNLQKYIRGFTTRRNIKRRKAVLMQGTKKAIFSQMIWQEAKKAGNDSKVGKAQQVEGSEAMSPAEEDENCKQPAQASSVDLPSAHALPHCVQRSNAEKSLQVKKSLSPSDVIEEAETLLDENKKKADPKTDSNLAASPLHACSRDNVSPVDNLAKVVPAPSCDGDSAAPHLSKKATIVDVHMPPWGHDLQKSIGSIGNQVEQLRRNQEEMASMMQQLYFLTFSSEHSNPTAL